MKDAKVLFPRLPRGLIGKVLQLAALVLFSFSALSAQGENEPLEINDLLLSNHTGTAIVLSWRTNKPTTVNQVSYGLDRNNLDMVMADSVFQEPSLIHFVRLIWLQPDTIYYYRVKSDNLEFSVSPSGVDSVVTYSQILALDRLTMEGHVTDQTNTPLPNVLVRSFISWASDSSMWYAVLTNPSGKFSMNFVNYRRYNGSAVSYVQNERTIHLRILGETQGALKDSVLLTAPVGGAQNLGIFELIDIRKKAMRGRIHTTTPVLADGRAASVVTVTILDDEGNPVPNVELEIRPSGGGTSVEGPFALTDGFGTAVGLVRSQVAEVKDIHVYNLTADSAGTAEIDTVGRVDFVDSLTDLSQDSIAPFFLSTTVLENTDDNVGPYGITSKVVDNFTFKVKLLYTTVSGTNFTDTLLMDPVSGASPGDPDSGLYYISIPGQAYNTVIKYCVIAEDSSGNAASYPPGILTDPFALPIIFEIIREGEQVEARMGINSTTDAFSMTNPELEVRIDTWITSTVGIRSAVIKWRDLSQGTNFLDNPMSNFGAHYKGYLPAHPRGTSIEYFIQAVDSLGRTDRDRSRAPIRDLYSYEVLALDPTATPSFADTTDELGTTDVRKTWHSVMADVNGDGYSDVITANYGEFNRLYFYNKTVGRLSDVTPSAFPNQLSEKTTHVAVADIDADDDLDLIFTNEGQQNRLYLNIGNGSFEDVTSRTFTTGGATRMPEDTWASTCVLADDFDGDGDIDLFIANNAFGGEQNRLLLNDSLGVFRDFSDQSGLTSESLDQSVWAVAGDLDGNEAPDIIVINRAQDHVMLVNNGSAIFQVKTVAEGSASTATGADLGDVDGDGDLDLIIAQTETQQNEFYLNNGLGEFTSETSVRLPLESDDTRTVKFFDANADGYLDLYYVNYGQVNRLLINDGLGHFSAPSENIMPDWESYSTAVAVDDLNQDNFPDLYISEELRRNTLVFSRSLSSDIEGLPSKFDLLSPAAVDTTNTFEQTFVWQASHSPDTTDAVSYTFTLSPDSLFTPGNQVDQRLLADTTVIIDGLTDETLYWWKVTAENSLGIPVSSNQVHSLMVLESWEGGDFEFLILVNRNPVFYSFLTIYIISTVDLSSDPIVTINLDSVSVTRQTGTNIWSARYQTRTGFLLNVQGTNLRGNTEEHTVTLSSATGGSSTLAAADGMAWLTLSTGEGAGQQVLFVQSHQPVSSEEIKTRLGEIGTATGLDYQDLAVILEGDCYSFTSFDTRLKTSAVVSIRDDNNLGHGNFPTICILENGVWVPLPTTYDSRTGAYNAVTDRLGTYALRAADVISGMQLPRGFALAQNSPNPFNPSTRISYTVPEREEMPWVRVKVYNLRGALVRVLVDDRQVPGTYAVEWNGRDHRGRDLPSGVYFYRLESEDKIITRKMVLIR